MVRLKKKKVAGSITQKPNLNILGNLSKRDGFKHATEALNFRRQPFGIPIRCLTSERGSANVDIHEDSEHENEVK